MLPFSACEAVLAFVRSHRGDRGERQEQEAEANSQAFESQQLEAAEETLDSSPVRPGNTAHHACFYIMLGDLDHLAGIVERARWS